MKKSVFIIPVAILCLSLFSFFIEGYVISGTDEVRRITKEDLKSLLNDSNTTIIDVRQEGDWQKTDVKIKGASREEPMREAESWARKYPKDRNIVLYCA